MKKTRMISVIAASLLTATVVFTGCGGGGSSVTSSSSSSSSSSATQITPKTVTVADGYVLGATVKAGNETAVATTAGHYEFADASKVAGTIVSIGGTNDLNENGQADANEPTAPTLKAPASYSNVNPMTTLMVEGGLTAQQIIDYYNNTYGLNLTTLDFDPTKADAKTKAEVVALGYLLTVMQNNASTAGVRDGAFPDLTTGSSSSSATTTSSSSSTATSTSDNNNGAFPDLNGEAASSSPATTSSSSEATSSSSSETSTSSSTCLPGQPCSSASSTPSSSSEASTSSSSSSAASNININTLADAIRNNLRLEEVYPNIADVLQDIRTKVENGKENDLTCDFTAHKACTTQGNGETSGGEMSSSEGMSSSTCLPGQPCGSSSSEEMSSSESMSNSEGMSSSTCLPGQPCGSSSSETSSAINTSSSNSQTSSTNSGNGEAFPDLNGGSTNSSTTTTSSVSSSSSSVSSTSNGGTTNSSGAFPDLSQ